MASSCESEAHVADAPQLSPPPPCLLAGHSVSPPSRPPYPPASSPPPPTLSSADSTTTTGAAAAAADDQNDRCGSRVDAKVSVITTNTSTSSMIAQYDGSAGFTADNDDSDDSASSLSSPCDALMVCEDETERREADDADMSAAAANVGTVFDSVASSGGVGGGGGEEQTQCSTNDPYSFVEEYADPALLRATSMSSLRASSASSSSPSLLSAPPSVQNAAAVAAAAVASMLPLQFPKKRGRKPKKLLEAMAAAGMEVPKYKTPVRSSDPAKPRKKRDRFNGLSEEELFKLTLPDHLAPHLDIVFIGINPGMLSAFKGHHYAGPGDHFWKCIYLSGLIPEPLAAEDDFRLPQLKIGFTNVVSRTTKGSQELSRKELKEGGKILLKKLQTFQPKIAVFNGKGIFEIFSGKKDFLFGKQPEKIEGTHTSIWVMPSSSARCAQLPRALDKVPFFVALRKFRDHLNGHLIELDDSEITFQPPRRAPTAARRPAADDDAAATCLPLCLEQFSDGGGVGGRQTTESAGAAATAAVLTVPIKKKRGRPRKIKLDENGQPLPDKPRSARRGSTAAAAAAAASSDDPTATTAAGRKKRGRPKKARVDVMTASSMASSAGGGALSAATQASPGVGAALPSVYEIGAVAGLPSTVEELTRLGHMTPNGGADFRSDVYSPYGGAYAQLSHHHHQQHLQQQQQAQHMQQQSAAMHPADMYHGCGYAAPVSAHYGHSPVYGGGGGGAAAAGSLCLTPPPTSPSLLDQPCDFDAPPGSLCAAAAADSGERDATGQQLTLLSAKNDDSPFDESAAAAGCISRASPFVTHTLLDQHHHHQHQHHLGGGHALQHQQHHMTSHQLAQCGSTAGGSQSLYHSVVDGAGSLVAAPTPLFSGSSASGGGGGGGGGGHQALPIDFSLPQQASSGGTGGGSGSGGSVVMSPNDGRDYDSPLSAAANTSQSLDQQQQTAKSADIAAKSLSGLESLVDQIPSIGSGGAVHSHLHHHHQHHHPAAQSSLLLHHHHHQQQQQQHHHAIYGDAATAAATYGSVSSAGAFSPPPSLAQHQQHPPPQQQQQHSPVYQQHNTNFSAVSLANSSVAAAATSSSPGPTASAALSSATPFFSPSVQLASGYPSSAAAAGLYNSTYGPYAAAAPYAGFHMPSPRLPYAPAAYSAAAAAAAASGGYHPSMPHHQAYHHQAASMFERWKPEHMDMRFGGGF